MITLDKKFNGRLIVETNSGEQTTTPKQWTLTEIGQAIKLEGATGMIHTNWYTIAGRKYSATALSIGAGHGLPHEINGKIVVNTRFRRELLGDPYRAAGDLSDLVVVDVVIDPEDVAYVSIVKKLATIKRIRNARIERAKVKAHIIDVPYTECPQCHHPRKAFVWHHQQDVQTKWVSCSYCGHEEEYSENPPDHSIDLKWLENIIEMSRTVQLILDHKDDYEINDDDFDSRDLIDLIPKWVAEFEQTHKYIDWDSADPHKKYLDGYYGLIDTFVIEKMQELYGVESVTPIH